MANTGARVKSDAIREIAATSITDEYQALGGVFLRDALREWGTNNTNGDIYLSTDGVTDMKKFPAYSARAMDDKTNDFYDPAGTQIYIRYESVPESPAGWFGYEVEYA